MTSVIIFLKLRISQTVDSKETNVLSISSWFILCHASHQLAHAALLSHSVLTLVVEAHLAGFAAEAVLRRVPRQEHHMLGCCTWYTHTHTHRKEAAGSDLSSRELCSWYSQVSRQKGRGNGNYWSEQHLIHLFVVFTLARVSESFPACAGRNLGSDMWNILTRTEFSKRDTWYALSC